MVRGTTNLFKCCLKSGENVHKTNKKIYEAANFETAITATGFGRFNYFMILLAVPSGWASIFESSSMSFVLPIAECDLNLSLSDKGWIISITYLGMLSSAIVWGFLSDLFGRKKLLVIGFLLTAIFTFLCGIAQSLPMILFSKFMSGFIINGPFAVLTAALSEFHCAKYRAKVILSMGIVFSVGNILMPILGWVLLPTAITLPIPLFGEQFELHSWHFFLLLCGVPALVSGIGHCFFPESPKFLMTAGRNDEALKVFQHIYAMNTGAPPETYPIKQLIDERNEHIGSVTSVSEFAHKAFGQMRPLFQHPHRMRILLVAIMQWGTMMGLNTLRQWMPQLFTALNDVRVLNEQSEASMCEMLGLMQEQSNSTNDCTINVDNDSVYINTIIVSLGSIFGYLVVGMLINLLGKKNLYVLLGVIAGIAGGSIYLSSNTITTIILVSIVVTLSGINTNVLLSVIVDLFPTTLRTMAVALSMMSGRFGSMMGNALFPLLINLGCLPPFMFIGISTTFCALLAMLLPKTDMKALE